MAPTPRWGFCQTLLRPERGTEQNRGAGSAPIPNPAASTAARCCGVSLCLRRVSLCLVPNYLWLFITYLLFSQPQPQLNLISCVSRGGGGKLPPRDPGFFFFRHQSGGGGSGGTQALSPAVSPEPPAIPEGSRLWEFPSGEGSVIPEHRKKPGPAPPHRELVPYRHRQRAPPARPELCRALIAC